MITVYKLTTQDNKTRKGEYNECTWGPNVTHSGTGEGNLCGPGFIHAYLSPALAVFLNPIHANIRNPKLWECVVPEIKKNDRDLKIGAIKLTTVRKIPLPVVSLDQRVFFAKLCADAARAADAAARDAASPAAYAADAAYAARAARDAASPAAYAARAAAYAARAADAACYAARAAAGNINLVGIAERSLNYGNVKRT